MKIKLRHFVLACLCAAGATAHSAWTTFAEGWSSPAGNTPIEMAFRMHTAPSLQDLIDGGMIVDRLEIRPRSLVLRVGDVVPVDRLTVLAFDDRDRVVDRAPLSFMLDDDGGDLLDLDAFASHGEPIRARAAGVARITVDSLLPSSSGSSARASLVLSIE